MLMAGGVEPPDQVRAHGFLTVGGQKMSKTNATGIHPFELADHFGVDSYRYFFMREIQFGQDGSFSWESMVDRHNADLANGLGNLASRILAMLGSSFDGMVPEPEAEGVADDLPALTADVALRYDEHMSELALTQALAAVWEIVGRANGYLVERQPWNLAKDETRRGELTGILYASAETLRILAILIAPIMPGAATRLWEQLGIEEPLEAQRLPNAAAWGGLRSGTKTVRGDALFPRLDS
jgi:methionyl-tRNA synthetase